MSETRSFRIGVDLGQKQDNSAVCLVEHLEPKVVVRLLVKYPLGTPYPLVFRTVKEVYDSAAALGEVISFAVDATGVGTSPSQMIQEMIPDARVEGYVFNNKNKRELVGKVKMLHAFNKLRFATRRGDQTYNRTLTELINEMRQLQVRVLRDDPNNPEMEVFKTGLHDDLFCALALAVKDIEIRESYESLILHEDTTWVKNPLTEPTYGEPVFFG
jgi:phage FluMu gp28-like protein